jgi:DNA modification methylase
MSPRLKRPSPRTPRHPLTISMRDIESLKPNPNNARTHSKHQIRQIADSIEAFGITNPVLTDKNGMIIAGHGRLEGCKELGITEVPTICLEDLTPDEVRAYALADNQIGLNAKWDDDIVAIELDYLLKINADFDVTITGFSVPEIDIRIGSVTQEDGDDAIEPTDLGPAVCRLGDVFCLGQHRVLCGDALREQSYEQLLGSHRAHMVFTDNPYNVKIDGHASGNGAIKHRDFPMACGEMSRSQFTDFLSGTMDLLTRYSRNGSVHFLCMDWRHIGELLDAGGRHYGSLLNMCVWNKGQGGMGSFYRSQHELVFVFKNGTAPHRNNIQLGRHGRNRTNVWHYPGANSFSRNNEEGNLLALHPTVKPTALVADAILDCSARNEIVLDCFLGSGTTLLAAERVGRVCHGIELDPRYVDVAVRRWQRQTGQQAVHAVTGVLFDDLNAEEVVSE